MNYPTIFSLLCEEFKRAGIPCALVGGFAVNHHKVTRQTADVDLMIVDHDYDKAFEILQGAGYRQFRKQEMFARFEASEKDQVDVDLLFVDQKTLEGILRDGEKVKIANSEFVVPSLDHLIAMKLHSLKSNPKLRKSRDFLDILELISRNKLAVRADHFRNLCVKYGSDEIYNEVLRYAEE